VGQLINVASSVIDDIAVFDTDRSIAGQDGAAYDRAVDTDDGTFPGELAGRLLAADPALDHVWVASNQVVARRPGGWDEAAVAAAEKVVAELFRFYDDV
jgi:hypothetical protein